MVGPGLGFQHLLPWLPASKSGGQVLLPPVQLCQHLSQVWLPGCDPALWEAKAEGSQLEPGWATE